jgi:hypothetical protein
VTLSDDASFLVESGDFIRAVPCAVLTAYTRRVIMPNDAVVKLDVGLCGATFKAFRF